MEDTPAVYGFCVEFLYCGYKREIVSKKNIWQAKRSCEIGLSIRRIKVVRLSDRERPSEVVKLHRILIFLIEKFKYLISQSV
jgi:hypothetical protein